MPSSSKVAQVALAVAVPTSVVLLYWWYKRNSSDEEAYGRRSVVTTRQIRIEMYVPKKAVGSVIGRQGAVIKQIQETSGARVRFNDKEENADPSSAQRLVVIHGTPEAAQQAELMIHQIISDVPELLTEEIEVPYYAIGRIIGKGGQSIREIQAGSGAKVNIDRSEDMKGVSQKRVVHLKGTQAQIDAAVTLIEEKLVQEEEFRAKLSVSAGNREKRVCKSTAQPNSRIKLKPMSVEPDLWDCEAGGDNASNTVQDSLPEKCGYFEVFVSAVEHPGHLWVQTVGTKALRLEELQNQITTFVGTDEAKMKYKLKQEDCVKAGQLVAARYEEGDSLYYRASVVGEDENGTLDLYFVDFGDNTFIHKTEVFVLRSDFASFPYQAIECRLSGVEPIGGEWTEAATTLFEDLAHCGSWVVLQCRVVGHAAIPKAATSSSSTTSSLSTSSAAAAEAPTVLLPLITLTDTNSREKEIDIGSVLVERGFAVVVDSTNQKSSSPQTTNQTTT